MTMTANLTASITTSIQAHANLLRLQDQLAALDLRLRNAAVDSAALADLEIARGILQTTLNALLQVESQDAPQAESADMHTRKSGGVGFERVSSRKAVKGPTPMAVHALGTLRVAANACTQWDRERGIAYGLGKVLTEYATATRDEVFGPPDA